MNKRSYPAKLLLFGEYTVLVGSRALALPVGKWSGTWRFADKIDNQLIALAESLSNSGEYGYLNVKNFNADIKSGLYFDSSIPWGYGLGSSAALTAAILDRYGPDSGGRSLESIIADLASIESYYHGHSSGFDPLVSYLNTPVLHENQKYSATRVVQNQNTPTIFLVNSGQSRQTSKLVSAFKLKLTDQNYLDNVIIPLKENVDHAIDYFLGAQWELFWQHLRLIGDMQFEHFKDMLPREVEATWSRVNRNPSICLKLCGAGGGGYFLGFAGAGVDIEEAIGSWVEVIDLGG